MTDNGGYFNNQHFRSMANTYGCEVEYTAAFALRSNGIVEQHNAIGKEMFQKVRVDHDFSAFRDAALLKLHVCQKMYFLMRMDLLLFNWNWVKCQVAYRVPRSSPSVRTLNNN